MHLARQAADAEDDAFGDVKVHVAHRDGRRLAAGDDRRRSRRVVLRRRVLRRIDECRANAHVDTEAGEQEDPGANESAAQHTGAHELTQYTLRAAGERAQPSRY